MDILGRMLQAQKLSRREVGVGLLCSKKTKKIKIICSQRSKEAIRIKVGEVTGCCAW